MKKTTTEDAPSMYAVGLKNGNPTEIEILIQMAFKDPNGSHELTIFDLSDPNKPEIIDKIRKERHGKCWDTHTFGLRKGDKRKLTLQELIPGERPLCIEKNIPT